MKFTGERFIPADNSIDELSVEHLHRYYSILPLVREMVVLDIACGEGYGTAIMAKDAKRIVGVDISKECISHATQKYIAHYPNISFLEGDVVTMPVEDGVFDVVVSFETMEHVSAEEQKKFLKEVKRVLKKGGLLIVSTPDKENYSERYHHENHFHVHELDREEFIELITEHFDHAQIMEQGFDIVSSITPPDYTGIDCVRLINWQEKVHPRKRKYLLALASDKPVMAKDVASIVLETDKDYFKQVDRILQLQDELEERTAWALRLDTERMQHEVLINTLKEQISSYNRQDIAVLTSKVDTIQQWLIEHSSEKQAKLDQLYAELKPLEERNQSQQLIINQQELAIAELQERNNALQEQNKQLEIKLSSLSKEAIEKDQLLQDLQFNFLLTKQQLSEVNNRLITIYDSDGWRFLERYYNLKGKYLNESSTHYKFLKHSFNFLRSKKEAIATTPALIVERKEAVNKQKNNRGNEEITIRTLPLFDQPKVSVIIPVYNAWEMNVKCLDAIIEHTKDVAYEVIIADDCSTDLTKEVEKHFINIVHVRNETNQGFLLNSNRAATFAKGQYIHFLNNDTEVKQGWLSSLVRILDNDENAGMVGSKLVYPNGKLQEAGGIIWNDASGWNFGQGQNPDMPEFNYVKEVDYISGASMMIRANLWKEIGGFDTRYSPAYCEDSDLAFSVRERGFKVMYQPLSEVIHYEGYSHGNDRESSSISSVKEYQIINNKKFYEKWKEVLKQSHFPNAEHVFWAKDRSRNKKTLLMVDHYVPQYDKDAGSRTTFQYLQLFVKLGFNVKFMGENFYKHEPYTTVLQQIGIEVLYGPWYRDNWQQWFKENNEKFDYVYLNRPHISINFIDFIKQNSRTKVLYYGHDLHFLREQKRYEVEKDAAILEQADKMKKLESYLFSNSDVILTPSTDEQQVIQAISDKYNVQLMRPYIYQDVSKPATDFDNRKDILFVGGFGHLPNVDGVLWFAKEVWPLIKAVTPDVRFIVAGSNPPTEVRNLSSSDVVIKGYVSDEELETLYKTCKIAVVPLRYGAGVKGKTVEAMRYGMPLVTTSFGIEGLPGDYSFIRVADTEQGFAESVLDIYNDEAALCYLSKKNVEYINENFTEEVAKIVLSKALATA